jgi:lysophospholipase L1-like esterase
MLRFEAGFVALCAISFTACSGPVDQAGTAGAGSALTVGGSSSSGGEPATGGIANSAGSNSGGANTGTGGATTGTGGTSPGLGVNPTPIISRGAPAFASSEYSAGNSAAKANDADYSTNWRSGGSSQSAPAASPQWLAYDLSKVPVAQRTKVVVFWFASPENGYVQYPGYDLPGQYTIDCHAGPGGGSPPAANDAGWTTLASVTDAPSATTSFTSRQHYISSFVDSSGSACNWVRMRVTSINGQSYNWDVAIQMDVHDASQGLDDDWIFFGDSITAGMGAQQLSGHNLSAMGGFSHNPLKDIVQADFDAAGAGSLWATLGTTGTVSELIAASKSDHFPLIQVGAVGGWLSNDGVAHVPGWLSMFPGKFVAVDYGTNDAGWAVKPADFQANMQTMIDAAHAAGKVVVIPTIPSPVGNANTEALNAVITGTLWKEDNVLQGPDLYAFFEAHPSLLQDGLHPTDVGYVCYRQLWVQKLLGAY